MCSQLKQLSLALCVLCFFTACSHKQYVIKSIEGSSIEMDSTWDAKADIHIVEIINSYKVRLGTVMNEKIGEAAKTMYSGRPQSLLANLTADAMKKYAIEHDFSDVDFAVVNVGGLRSSLNQGPITIGNVYEVYPFDNKLVILDVPGEAVTELFNFYAWKGGEGISSDVMLKVKDKKVQELKIDGHSIDNNKIYRIATLDYLAEGNDGMTALTKAIKTEDPGIMLRDLMIDYIKKCTIEKQKIDSKLDDRIIIE